MNFLRALIGLVGFPRLLALLAGIAAAIFLDSTLSEVRKDFEHAAGAAATTNTPEAKKTKKR